MTMNLDLFKNISRVMNEPFFLKLKINLKKSFIIWVYTADKSNLSFGLFLIKSFFMEKMINKMHQTFCFQIDILLYII